MAENNIKVWKLAELDGVAEVNFPGAQSLDEITRQLPQGLYTTFRTYDGGKRVLGLAAHLERLYQPASTRKIIPTSSAAMLRHHLAGILDDYPSEARVRLIITKSGAIYIAITPLKPLPPEIYQLGVKAIITDIQRKSPRMKSTAFVSASKQARSQIAKSETFEALLLKNNRILEGISSNFFYVKDSVLGTARNDVLLGVTRQTVLRVARGSGISIDYRAWKRKQIPALDEAFITSSSRGIVPVIQIDDMTVGWENG